MAAPSRSSGTSTSPIYETYFPSPPGHTPPPPGGHVERARQALRESPEFHEHQEVRHDWRRTYGGDEYLKLLQTYSDRSRLAPPDHAHFLADMARVIDRAGGTVTREYQTVTLLARRT